MATNEEILAGMAEILNEVADVPAEDVTEEILQHAADRAIDAARAASALGNGREPQLTPGVYCSWCPQAATCPVAELPPAS